MIFRWEKRKEKLSRYMSISPKKKLEWLRQMNEFIAKCTMKRDRAIRRKLREIR